MQNNDDLIVERLDMLLGVVRLAFDEPIRAAASRVRSDPVSAEVLDATETEWVGAGALKDQVRIATRASDRTVSRRIAELVSQSALKQRGSGSAVSYRATGLL